MTAAKVTFPLAPVYERAGIEFAQASAREIHPDGDRDASSPYVIAQGANGKRSKVGYDFLINATGPALRFDKTEGLGPDGGHSLSVCLPQYAAQAAATLDEEVERMRRGDKRRFLVGVGHGTCTCEGAAFEYIVNLEFALRNRGVRDRAEITWITNEYELGDFGMGGMHLKRSGYITPSSIFNASLFAERRIDWITRAHVHKVRLTACSMKRSTAPSASRASISLRDAAATVLGRGAQGIRPRRRRHHRPGVSSKRVHAGERRLHAQTARTVEGGGLAADLPVARVLQPVRGWDRVRAAAPDLDSPPESQRHRDRASAPTDRNALGDHRQGRRPQHRRHARRRADADAHRLDGEMGAACVASAGANPFTGTAASMRVFPIVPDYERYPQYGRDLDRTFGEIGLAGHWIKILLHHLFLHKARMRPGWRLIPE